jgi:hypothetical protein
MSEDMTQPSRSGRLFAAFVGLALLMGLVVFLSRSNRFPYQGTWQAGGPNRAYTASFHFAADGACTTDYSTGKLRLKAVPCPYAMENGVAVMEYVFNWTPIKTPQWRSEYVTYHVRLTPVEGGRVLVLRPVYGIAQRTTTNGQPATTSWDFRKQKEVRFKRIDD